MIKTSLPWWNLKTRHLRVVVFFFWHILHINENILQLPLVIVPNQKHLKFVKKIIIEEKKIRAVEILVPELLLRQVVLNLNISVISSSRIFFFGGNPDKQLFLPDYYCYMSIRASSFPLTTNNSLEAPRRERGLKIRKLSCCLAKA